MKKIIIGVDFSEASVEAVRWVRQHFAPDASVELLNSIELAKTPAFLQKAIPHFDQWITTSKNGADARLREITQELGGNPFVAEGRPNEALLERARETGAELIAVGAQGESRGVGKIFGSTPDDLLVGAEVPVLIVRHPKMKPLETLLVAVDESSMTAPLLRVARETAAMTGARIVLLRVVSTWVFDRMRMHGGSHDELEALVQKQFDDARAWLTETAEQNGLENYDVAVEGGSPDLEIVRVAAELDPDLVLIGTRGEGQKPLPFIGGSARHVARNSPCPLLLVTG